MCSMLLVYITVHGTVIRELLAFSISFISLSINVITECCVFFSVEYTTEVATMKIY